MAYRGQMTGPMPLIRTHLLIVRLRMIGHMQPGHVVSRHTKVSLWHGTFFLGHHVFAERHRIGVERMISMV